MGKVEGRARLVQSIDAQTGEVLHGAVVLVPERARNQYRRWLAMSQDAVIDALLQLRKLDELRVFLALLRHLDYDNLVLVSQKRIAEELGMHKSNVSKAIRSLVERGFLVASERIGNVRAYRLSPLVAWKGKAEEHQRAIIDFERERKRRQLTLA